MSVIRTSFYRLLDASLGGWLACPAYKELDRLGKLWCSVFASHLVENTVVRLVRGSALSELHCFRLYWIACFRMIRVLI